MCNAFCWQLSKTAKNLIEEQRALATIGRTWFVYSDSVSDPDEVEESLLNAQAAYQDSLSVCDKLRDSVPEKELLQMRSRLYLNLGLIYDSRDDLPRSHKFMENALSIARCTLWCHCHKPQETLTIYLLFHATFLFYRMLQEMPLP